MFIRAKVRRDKYIHMYIITLNVHHYAVNEVEPPIIRNRIPFQTDIQHASPASLILFVTGQGEPIPTFTWFKDDELLSVDERITISSLPNPDVARVTSFLSIQDTSSSDSGYYTCVVSNAGGSVMTFFNVTVNGKTKKNNKKTIKMFASDINFVATLLISMQNHP